MLKTFKASIVCCSLASTILFHPINIIHMQKTIVFNLLILVFCANFVNAQNNLTETEKLVATAKVWGFLKYYHPNVADGKYDWDQQLFEVLPKVKKANNSEQLSQVFSDWINTLGKVKSCKKCHKASKHDYFKQNFDLSWIENEKFFNANLSKLLKHIELNRHQGKKHYVKYHSGVGNIEVINEKSYKDFDWKDEKLRLLALFRYWNIIEYFFPYKYQTDLPWEDVLKKMVPKFQHAKTEQDLHLAMLEVIVCIDDSHGVFATLQTRDFLGAKWSPARFEFINDTAIITGFYNDTLARLDDVRVGDIITKIDGKTPIAIFKEREKYIYGSNQAVKKHKAYNAILNGTSDSVNVEFLRDGKTFSKFIKRYSFKALNYDWKNRQGEKYKILPDNIGYVNMGIITKEDIPQAMEALAETKAIVFDIRNYPKGTLYLISKYITSSRRDFFKVTYPDLEYPGKFIWRNGTQCGDKEALKYKGKVILLVNAKSQSHAEFTAMCLQVGDHVTTIGSQTSGADGNVSRFEMVGGFKTMISGIGIFYPDHSITQRKGVKVDIEVHPSIQGIIKGKDEVLEKAIALINEQ